MSMLKNPLKLFLVAIGLIAVGFGFYILEWTVVGVCFILTGALVGLVAFWVYKMGERTWK